jgi:hypothetical protein
VNYSKEFVKLNKEIHDRASFDCGEVELNEFIQKYAAKNSEVGISTTMVLPASEPLGNGKFPICAFYTVAPGSIARETLPASLKKKLPHYPIPVFLIAQMAVHLSCQGSGLGKVTLIKALEYLWNINEHMQAYAVIVDCINTDIVKFYSKYDFQILDPSGRIRMFLPMQTVGMLFQQQD